MQGRGALGARRAREALPSLEEAAHGQLAPQIRVDLYDLLARVLWTYPKERSRAVEVQNEALRLSSEFFSRQRIDAWLKKHKLDGSEG